MQKRKDWQILLNRNKIHAKNDIKSKKIDRRENQVANWKEIFADNISKKGFYPEYTKSSQKSIVREQMTQLKKKITGLRYFIK